jgi:hypothetical protein
MVKRLKLNEKALREAEPIEGNSYQIFDTEILGLAAKVQTSGMRTFTLDYRYANVNILRSTRQSGGSAGRFNHAPVYADRRARRRGAHGAV